VKKFIVTDGTLVLTLEQAPEGGYTVTSPFEPGLVTEGETISECFEMAHDALATLIAARRSLRRRPAQKGRRPRPMARSA
jgi:predicted RNase H-like HicB family nuclease